MDFQISQLGPPDPCTPPLCCNYRELHLQGDTANTANSPQPPQSSQSDKLSTTFPAEGGLMQQLNNWKSYLSNHYSLFILINLSFSKQSMKSCTNANFLVVRGKFNKISNCLRYLKPIHQRLVEPKILSEDQKPSIFFPHSLS